MLTFPLASSHSTTRASPPSALIAGRALSRAFSIRLRISVVSLIERDYIGTSTGRGEVGSRITAGHRERTDLKSPHGRKGMDSKVEKTLLVIGAPEHDAAAYHLSGFLAPDPVICLRVAGKVYLAVSSMEYGRAKREARADEVLSFDELGVMQLARELK